MPSLQTRKIHCFSLKLSPQLYERLYQLRLYYGLNQSEVIRFLIQQAYEIHFPCSVDQGRAGLKPALTSKGGLQK